jgi:hypothetical protein
VYSWSKDQRYLLPYNSWHAASQFVLFRFSVANDVVSCSTHTHTPQHQHAEVKSNSISCPLLMNIIYGLWYSGYSPLESAMNWYWCQGRVMIAPARNLPALPQIMCHWRCRFKHRADIQTDHTTHNPQCWQTLHMTLPYVKQCKIMILIGFILFDKVLKLKGVTLLYIFNWLAKVDLVIIGNTLVKY